MNLLITGAAGYLGKETVRIISTQNPSYKIFASDIRDENPFYGKENIEYHKLDIRSSELSQFMNGKDIDVVVHLACMVPGRKKVSRELEYNVDVLGTKNVLEASGANNVKKIIITSSGAAYGYHADNPDWLNEEDPLRGNYEFAYSHHKKLVEQLMSEYKEKFPLMKQLILRPGAILGKTVQNQITNLFDQPVIWGLRGSDSPFTFIWDEDVVQIIVEGITSDAEGAFNLAGDGKLSMAQIAKILKKPYIPLPATLVKTGLFTLNKLGLTTYGPDQINFLRYRPVLSNKKLKAGLFKPRKSTAETFYYYLQENSKEFQEINL